MPIKKYVTSEGTVVWNSEKCIHSAECVKGLPSVFNPKSSPWINVEGASANEILAQVRKCPSGALSVEEDRADSEARIQIEALEDGPLMLRGKVRISYPDGSSEEKDKCALCRCGASSNKPFCDGTHRKTGFKS